MTGLQILWGVGLLVTLAALPMGAIRMLAYRSGEIDHSPTMLTAAWVALGIGLLGLVILVVTSVLLLS
ncbi:MAG TPA: hypothetical protein VFG63_03235 [Nocardioidaceae bacterium]|nr:hypothetical protein [Nocardioidaceae bacterium]